MSAPAVGSPITRVYEARLVHGVVRFLRTEDVVPAIVWAVATTAENLREAALADEGRLWVRGHLEEEDEAVLAARVARVL